MGIVARTILRYKCNHTGATFLRLCTKSYYRSGSNRTLAADTYKKLLGKYDQYPLSHRYSSVVAHTRQLTGFFEANENVPEHKIIHSLLQKSVHYQDSIIPPIKTNAIVTSEDISQLYRIDWSIEPVQNVFNAMKKLTYCYLSGSSFEMSLYNSILQSITLNLPKMQDQQLKILIQCSIVLNDVTEKSHFYKNFLGALNKECLERYFPASINQLLLMSDAFYQLKDYNSAYLWRAMRKLSGKPQSLSAKALVQVMFLLNIAKLGSVVNMFEIEYRLEECLYELTGDEIGIIARGFFLRKRGIRNKSLMPAIMSRITSCAQQMQSTSLASATKLIRYSGNIHCLSEFQELLIALRKEIPRLSLKCLTHIMHASGGLRVYDEHLTNIILERVKNDAKIARLKDIERIIYGICTVTPYTNYYNDVCCTLLDEVSQTYQTNRLAEINRYPVSFFRIMIFLAMRNIYVPELIQYAFDPTFVQKTYKNNLKLLSSELLTLHCSVKIELPNYKGPFLNDHLYQYLIKKYNVSDDVHRKDNAIKFKTDVVFISKNKLGISVCVDYILPHSSTSDIVFGMDERNNIVDVEPILSAMPAGSIKSVNRNELKNIKWKVLFFLPTAAKVLGHDGYSGTMYSKFRQLKAIGYTPIPICEQKWSTYADEEKKEDYLRQLIYRENNNDL